MKSKIDQLPDEMLLSITDFCTEKEKQALANYSLRMNGLFSQPPALNTLMNCVAEGEQAKAQEILKNFPILLVQVSSVKDSSGRLFHTSPFLLAVWNLDTRYMAQMMIESIPDNEKGNLIKSVLLKQLTFLEQNGLTYLYNHHNQTEKHFDFKPLIQAMDSYIRHYNQWDGSTRDQAWWDIGIHQSHLPAHVIQQLCEQNASGVIIDNPSLTKASLSRCMKVFDPFSILGKTLCEWPDIKATQHCAIARSGHAMPTILPDNSDIANLTKDLELLKKIEKMRIKDIEILKQKLSNPAQSNENNQCCIVS